MDGIRQGFGNVTRGWHSLGRWRPWVVTALCFLAILVLQFRHRDLPPYWDGTVNFAASYSIEENHFSPFLPSADTGHPPLLAWTLAVVRRAGVQRMIGFHLLTWICAGVFLGAVWRLGRRTGSEAVGWVSALLVGLNPCVAGQALQFNLDLPMAAFGVLALALFAEGRFWTAGIAAAVMALTKLNGIFGVIPLGLFSAGLVMFDRRYRSGRAVLGLAWTCLFPVAVLGLFLGAKSLVLHRFFDSGEYAGGKQVALVANLSDYIGHVYLSLYQALANNGMWYFLCAIPMVATMRWSLRRNGVTDIPSSKGMEPIQAEEDAPEKKDDDKKSPALRRGQVFGLLGIWLLAQILLQSIRSMPTIPRYFMVIYPALVVPVVWGIWASLPGRRVVALGLLVVVLGGIQVIKWTPRYWHGLHGVVQLLVSNPSADTMTNHEWSLGFVDILEQTRPLARKLENRIQPGQSVGGEWPFNVYLTDPRFGFVKKPHKLVNPGYPDWWNDRGRADFIVVHDGHPFHHPLSHGHPGAKGLELLKSRTGEVGSLALYQFHPEQAK